jgi:radical SAM superfamily enzyme YgiQ (UPF0313 family)
MDVTVFMADPRHDYGRVLINDMMPLNIGYLKAVMDRDLPSARSRLFVYPELLGRAIRETPPDVLMLSNYIWNEELSLRYARYAKEIRPETLVVMGGPNINIDENLRSAFMNEHPEIDVYVLGEGDFLATELVKEYVSAGKSIPRFLSGSLPSCMYRKDGAVVTTSVRDRHAVVDDVPSPWLTGVLDEFFDGKLAPMIETNRGCPFQCTFCVQGTRWYTKVHYFSMERVLAEVDYIGARIKKVCPSMGTLMIADANYAMFERDLDISRHLGKAQGLYGWPTFINATTGKNRPDRIIQAVEEVNGAMVVYQAVQSLDERTLENIKRSNISTSAYEKVMIHVRGRGLRSNSDLILGLPGETLESHLKSFRTLIDAGTHELHNMQAMVLRGCEMERMETREAHGLVTKFRLAPKNSGIYEREKVFDLDEIVVESSSMSFEDYVTARKHHFASSVLWNNSWFEHPVKLAVRFGYSRSEWLSAMLRAIEADEGRVGTVFRNFVEETKNELFPSRAACIEHYSTDENWEKVQNGQIGDNLMYKYRALASFFVWPELCRIAMSATRALLVDREVAATMPEFEAFWAALSTYVELSHAHGATADEIVAPQQATLRFAIAEWIAAGAPAETSAFELTREMKCEFRLPDNLADEVRRALEVWSTKLQGLVRAVTRIRAVAQVRVCVPLEAVAFVEPRREPASLAPTTATERLALRVVS